MKHSPGKNDGSAGELNEPPHVSVICIHVVDPAGLYPTAPVTPPNVKVTGVSKSNTTSGEPTSITVLPTENLEGAVPELDAVFGGCIVPFHPSGASMVVPSGIDTDTVGNAVFVRIIGLLVPDFSFTAFFTITSLSPIIIATVKSTFANLLLEKLVRSFVWPPISILPLSALSMLATRSRTASSFSSNSSTSVGSDAWPLTVPPLLVESSFTFLL